MEESLKTYNNFYNFYRIVWYLTNVCNIDCSYCEDHIRPKGIDPVRGYYNYSLIKEIPEEYIRKVSENIKSLSEFDNYKFKIYGGETTLYPSLPKFFDILYDEFNISTLKFSTNGLARPLSYYKDFLHYPYDSFLFQLTVHLEFYRESIKKVIDFFLENNVKVQINFLFDTSRKEQFYNIFEDFYFRYFDNVNCTIIPFIIYKDMNFTKGWCIYSHTDKSEFQELLDRCKSKDPFRLINDDFETPNIRNNFKNFSGCIYGTRGIMINSNCCAISPCEKIKVISTPIYLMSKELFRKKFYKKIRCLQVNKCEKSTVKYY